jgi:hypothetical protein
MSELGSPKKSLLLIIFGGVGFEKIKDRPRPALNYL